MAVSDTPSEQQYMLRRNWDALINVVCGIEVDSNYESGRLFLKNYLKQARFPEAKLHLIHGGLDTVFEKAPVADLEIVGLPENFEDFHFMRKMREETKKPCLFVKGTGREKALA